MSESSKPFSLLSDLKSLAGKSAVYGIGNVALKVIGFLLIPLYTRHLTTEDYGIMGITATVIAILGIIFPLSLHGALMKFYYDTSSPEQRKIITGNIWFATLVVSTFGTIILDRVGGYVFPLIFTGIPFQPYIRISIWTAYFTVFSLIPKTLIQAQERPLPFVIATTATTVISIGLVIYLVVSKQMGVYGYLIGMMIGNAVMVIPYIIFMLKNISFKIKPQIILAVLSYSLPLVPHGLASWILELSDRVILERNVSLSDLGLYNLGYQFGTILIMAANAINMAMAPYIFKTIGEDKTKANDRISPVITYYYLILIASSLGIELIIKDVVQIMTTPEFHSVYAITYWIVAAQLLSASYYIPANILFVEGKTKYIPLVTIISGTINVGLNLWLVPIYGYMASAWATFIAYLIMLYLVWNFSQRFYKLKYEYKRIGLAVIAATIPFIISLIVPVKSLWCSFAIKICLFASFPLLLYIFKFFNQNEKEKISEIINKIPFINSTKG